jgi:hypothetical protein
MQFHISNDLWENSGVFFLLDLFRFLNRFNRPQEMLSAPGAGLV